MSKVDDLDPSMVLAAAAATERESRMVELRRLELAVQWCVQHPATAETGVATHNPDTSLPGRARPRRVVGRRRDPRRRGVHPRAVRGRHGDVPGRRCPAVGRRPRPDPPPPQAVAPRPGIGDPRVAGPPGRPTHPPPLPRGGAGGSTTGSPTATPGARSPWTGWSPTPSPASTPKNTQRREDKGQASWDVELVHPGPTEFTGTSELHARGDTLDLTKFYDLVCDTAHQLRTLGDPDELGARKAKALGVLADLAHGQAALDLAALVPQRRAGKVRLYLHVDADDLDQSAVGDVERLGPATIAKIREWVGHAQVTIQPVLDLGRGDAVDQHDPPAWMREIVTLRDRHCVFPGCRVDARSCDLDHIDPYLDPGDGGPPGQTSAQRTSPASADDTTEPRPPGSGDTTAPPTTTATSGTARTARRTSSPPPALLDPSRLRG